MRIAIGQLWQETNTFNPWPTTRADFEQYGIVRGQPLIEQFSQTNELGGFIQALRDWPERPEIVGLVRLPAWPSGAATAETFDWLRQELVDALQQALPVDGVLLALHGALAAARHPDVEGEVLAAYRELLGPKVPLVATLDLHANLTARKAGAADALVLFHTVPHIDVLETGRRGAGVLRRLLGGARPVTAFQKLPMVVPPQLANTEDPASVSFALKRQLQELEADPRVLTAGLALVQPWLDVPELGGGVVVTADGDAELARAACAEIAGALWRQREQLIPEMTPVEEAVQEAFNLASTGLVVLSDGADATTSGAPGDSSWCLRELVKYDWPRPALVTLVAADVVKAAKQRGPGAGLVVPLGGRLDHRFSQPLELATRVVKLFDARFTLTGHLGTNVAIDMGLSAVLQAKNVHILVTSRSGPHFAPELFRLAGFDPFAASVLVAKSPCGFRAAYQSRAARIILVQAPGCAPADFWNYEYRHIPHPLWPWDEIPDWRPAPGYTSR